MSTKYAKVGTVRFEICCRQRCKAFKIPKKLAQPLESWDTLIIHLINKKVDPTTRGMGNT